MGYLIEITQPFVQVSQAAFSAFTPLD